MSNIWETQIYSHILYGVTCGGQERRTTTFICRLAHFIHTPTYLVIVIVIKHIRKRHWWYTCVIYTIEVTNNYYSNYYPCIQRYCRMHQLERHISVHVSLLAQLWVILEDLTTMSNKLNHRVFTSYSNGIINMPTKLTHERLQRKILLPNHIVCIWAQSIQYVC